LPAELTEKKFQIDGERMKCIYNW